MKNIEKYLITLFLFLLTQSSFTFAQSSNSNFPNCTSGNCINGQGTATFSNGDQYEGDFKNNELISSNNLKKIVIHHTIIKDNGTENFYN